MHTPRPIDVCREAMQTTIYQSVLRDYRTEPSIPIDMLARKYGITRAQVQGILEEETCPICGILVRRCEEGYDEQSKVCNDCHQRYPERAERWIRVRAVPR